MGFSLGGLLGPALTVATQSAGTYQQGQANAQQAQTQALMQQIALKRQADQDALRAALQTAQTGEANARTNVLNNPPPKGGDFELLSRPDGVFRVNKATGEEQKLSGIAGTPTPRVLKMGKNGQYVSIDPATGLDASGKPVEGYIAPVQSSFTFPVVDSPNGPVLAKANTKTGEVVPTDIGKSPVSAGGAGGLSGITMQTMARMGTSYNDLTQAVDQMDRMENDPAFRAKLTTYNKALMAGAETQPNAEAKGLGGLVSNMAGQYAAGHAQQALDPDLNTYLNLRQRVGTAFTELLPRPNQQLLQIEKGLSGIDVGWNPELLKGIQTRRQGGLTVLKNILSKQGMIDAQGNLVAGDVPAGNQGGRGGRGGGGAPTPKLSSAAWAAANPPKPGESRDAYHARYATYAGGNE